MQVCDQLFQVLGSICNYLGSVNWEPANKFLNSNFSTSLLGALAGAWGGAYAAQKIAAKAKHQDELLSQILVINSAIAISSHICVTYFGFKKEMLSEIVGSYKSEKARLLKYQEEKKSGTPTPGKFSYISRLEFLNVLNLPTDRLQSIVFEKLNLPARPTTACTTLKQTIESLNTTINQRNQLIEQNKGAYESNSGHILYFGLEQDEGHIDTRYPDTLTSIELLTDDAIFFSSLICEDLQKAGKKLLAKYANIVGKNEYKIRSPSFDNINTSTYWPNPENYPDWLHNFVDT